MSAWSATSFTELERLATDEDTGVAMVEGTELHRSRTADPWWSAAVPALTRVRAMPAPYVDGWSFRAPVVEMPVYLRWLAGQVVEAGGTITRMALGGLPDQAEVVVNASGLGARLIGSDPSVLPVRGQVVHVEQFGLDRWWLDGAGPTYVVPRSKDVVVGGTDEEGEEPYAGPGDRRADPGAGEPAGPRAGEGAGAAAQGGPASRPAEGAPGGGALRGRPGRALLRARRRRGHASWGCADEVAALVGPGLRQRRRSSVPACARARAPTDDPERGSRSEQAGARVRPCRAAS